MEEKKKLASPKEDRDRDDRINKKLALMKHKDLQVECILRGMEFNKVVELDHHGLSNWFYHNFEKDTLDASVLSEYDIWVEKQLEERGYKKGDSIFHPCFRLGFTPDMENLTPNKSISPIQRSINTITTVEVEKVSKPKREKDESTGVYTGTKKNLTYTLQKKGLELPEIIKKVMESFPDAKDKSIKIWYNRSKNGE